MQASLKINDGWIMLSDEFPEHGFKAPAAGIGHPAPAGGGRRRRGSTGRWARAASSPCRSADQFWGDRYGQIQRPVRPPLVDRAAPEGMTPNAFRALALALPGWWKGRHIGPSPTFAPIGRIFAKAGQPGRRPRDGEAQPRRAGDAAWRRLRTTSRPAAGAWGREGSSPRHAGAGGRRRGAGRAGLRARSGDGQARPEAAPPLSVRSRRSITLAVALDGTTLPAAPACSAARQARRCVVDRRGR